MESNHEYTLDTCAGAYPISCQIYGTTDHAVSRYSFIWEKGGLPMPLLMYALTHHVTSFVPVTAACVTPIKMRTITKGMATAVQADQWIMEEKVPLDIGFAPYHLQRGSIRTLSPETKSMITPIAARELEQDFHAQCCLNSIYFSGKGLAKFAMIIWVLHDMIGNPELVEKGMRKLKEVFAVFVENRQQNPLVFDETWKGVISTAGLSGDPGQDFGNSFYNDHHFHYGYFLYAAAVIGYIDPAWLTIGRSKAWVNMLTRDFANPSVDDFFPFSRSFDWYAGHSWVSKLQT